LSQQTVGGEDCLSAESASSAAAPDAARKQAAAGRDFLWFLSFVRTKERNSSEGEKDDLKQLSKQICNYKKGKPNCHSFPYVLFMSIIGIKKCPINVANLEVPRKKPRTAGDKIAITKNNKPSPCAPFIANLPTALVRIG
jgi:hypothetical protein